ncbi:putative UPF0481 protein At3g02645 [Arachis duranensis]|uniref:UPF0481 protein At3g02645 n=1 Tax=Arachis duranensis TaxID=130453 RepID=A0A6P4B7J0_ARADU|nr:putative UPF0481 protein At3g02645 [Arachis duranensis]
MDHNHVMNDIRRMLQGAEPPLTTECCIYKVPFDIRRLNHDAYTPKVVSIGPFHHGSPMLQNMERHKLIYCNEFLQRAGGTTLDLDSFVSRIEQAEPDIRRCYSDIIHLSPEELVKVVLVDCTFIFELFWRHFYGDWSKDDTLLWKPWLTTNIRLDLLLLENQIPFSILEDLFNHSGVGKVHSFLDLTFDYFGYYNSSHLTPHNVKIEHFTDLLRVFYLKPLESLPFTKGRTNESMIQLKSATELVDAGVKFDVNTKSNCAMDLRFSGKKVLEIPMLRVEDWTETLFRNMMALEQCHYPDEAYFTDYIAVLDFLINTSRDVDVLVEKGILVNWLGDADSVASLFNGLWKNITHVNFSEHYYTLCRDLDLFCIDPLHKMKATLWRDYGRTPWQAAASIAGFLLLILSLIQTVCSILQVVPK